MENASKRLPVVPAFVLAACLLCILSVWPLAGPALAASVYFADPLGNTEISVDPDEDFQIVLNVVDVTALAGYEAKIIASGPITPIDSAAHGTWFATGHTLFGPYEGTTAPADYHTAMLLSPTAISGSGALVVFSFHSGEDGIATIDVDPDYFILGDSTGTKMTLDPPSTISITVGTGGMGGEGLLGGEFLLGEEIMTSGEPGCFIKGDVNRDGRANILDLIAIRCVLNQTPDTPAKCRADVNVDGRLNILDLIAVRNLLSNQEPFSASLEVTFADEQHSPVTCDATSGKYLLETSETEQTSVMFFIVGYRPDILAAYDAQCNPCGGSVSFSYHYTAGTTHCGRAELAFARTPDPGNPEIHDITVTATDTENSSCWQQVVVQFIDHNACLWIPEAQDGKIYSPVGQPITVSAETNALPPVGGTYTWHADSPAYVQADGNSATLTCHTPGTYPITVTYEAEGISPFTRTYQFVAYEARYIGAVRPDLTETTSATIVVGLGVVTLHAAIYPEGVPYEATWSWTSDPASGGDLPFIGPTQLTDPSTASFEITGYADDFDVEVYITAQVTISEGNEAVLPVMPPPHISVPRLSLQSKVGQNWRNASDAVYFPVGQYTAPNVRVLLNGAPPTQGDLLWTTDVPGVLTPHGLDGASFSSDEPGEYSATVTYQIGETQFVRGFRITFFELRYLKAVRSDGATITGMDIYCTQDYTLQIYAEVYPPIPGEVDWLPWAATRADLTSDQYIDFHYDDTYSFDISSSGDSATVTISGYDDAFDTEISVSADTLYGRAELPDGAKPHVLVPTAAMSIAGREYSEDTRVPCTGHNTGSSSLCLGAPNDVAVYALVSTMRSNAPVTWSWELEGDAFLTAQGREAIVKITDQTTIAVSVSISVDGLALETLTVEAQVVTIDTGGVHEFYLGNDEIAGESVLSFDIPTGMMPPDVNFQIWPPFESYPPSTVEMCEDYATIEYRSEWWNAVGTYSTLIESDSEADWVYHTYSARSVISIIFFGIMDNMYDFPKILINADQTYEWDPNLPGWVPSTIYVDSGSISMEVFSDPALPVPLCLESQLVVPGVPAANWNAEELTLTTPEADSTEWDPNYPYHYCRIDVSLSTSIPTQYSASSATKGIFFKSGGGIVFQWPEDPWDGEEVEGSPITEIVTAADRASSITLHGYPDDVSYAWERSVLRPIYWFPEDPLQFVPVEGGSSVSCTFPRWPGIELLLCHSIGPTPPLIRQGHFASYRIIAFGLYVSAGADTMRFQDINEDDDDGDGVLDYEDSDGVVGEDDMLAFGVDIVPTLELLRTRGVRLEVEKTDNLVLWTTRTKDPGTEYTGDVDAYRAGRLYVEAISEVDGQDTHFILRLVGPEDSMERTVEISPAKIQFVMPDSRDDMGLPVGDTRVVTDFVPLSDPHPVVALDPVTTSDVTLSENEAAVSIHGYVYDPALDNASKYWGRSVRIYVDGEELPEGLSPVDIVCQTVGTPTFWRQHPFRGQFWLWNIPVPLQVGNHLIRVESYTNDFGNTGIDEVMISLGKREIPGPIDEDGTAVTMSMSPIADPSSGIADLLDYYAGDDQQSGVTLVEQGFRTCGSYGTGEGELISPMDVACDSSGNVYVADTINNRIQKFTSGGQFVLQWSTDGAENLAYPYGISVVGEVVYVADLLHAKIRRFDLAGQTLGACSDTLLTAPIDVAADSDGTIYVVDAASNTIVKFIPGQGWAQWFTDSNTLNGVAVSSDSSVFVTDSSSLRKLTSGGTQLWQTAATLDNPSGVAADAAGLAHVCESGTGKVLCFSPAGALLGEWGCSGTLLGQFSIGGGAGLTTTTDGRVSVADSGNNRIQSFIPDNLLVFYGELDGIATKLTITQIGVEDPNNPGTYTWSTPVNGSFSLDPDLHEKLRVNVVYMYDDGTSISFNGKEFAEKPGQNRVFQASLPVAAPDPNNGCPAGMPMAWLPMTEDLQGTGIGEYWPFAVRAQGLTEDVADSYYIGMTPEAGDCGNLTWKDGAAYLEGASMNASIMFTWGKPGIPSQLVSLDIIRDEVVRRNVLRDDGKTVMAKLGGPSRAATGFIKTHGIMKYAAGTTVLVSWKSSLVKKEWVPTSFTVHERLGRGWFSKDYGEDAHCHPGSITYSSTTGECSFEVTLDKTTSLAYPCKDLWITLSKDGKTREEKHEVDFNVVPLKVIIVAVDGFGYDAAKEAITGSECPTFKRLFENAAGLNNPALSPLPSITLAAWPSVFSGTAPNEHGWTGNAHFPRENTDEHLGLPVMSGNTDADVSLLPPDVRGIDQRQGIGLVTQRHLLRDAYTMPERCLPNHGSIYDDIASVAVPNDRRLECTSIHVHYAYANSNVNLEVRPYLLAPFTHGIEQAAKHDKMTGTEGYWAWEKSRRWAEQISLTNIPLDVLTLYYPGPDCVAHFIGWKTTGDWEGGAVGEVTKPLPSVYHQVKTVTDPQLKKVVDKIEADGYLNACMFALVADHGMMAYRNNDRYNITAQDYTEDEKHQGATWPDEEMQALFETPTNASPPGLGLSMWRGDAKRLGQNQVVFSPNGGMAQIYLREENYSWQDPPSDALVKGVASLLYREALGHSGFTGSGPQIYPDLAPFKTKFADGTLRQVSNGALGNPPAIFIKVGGGNNFLESLQWVKKVDEVPPHAVTTGTIQDFILERGRVGWPADWPEFEKRLAEMNHNDLQTAASGSRTGDIVLVLDGALGYMAVTHGEDMLNGWHGGPERAESLVPLMFSMPGPDLVRSSVGFIDSVYTTKASALGQDLRNWHMGEILTGIANQVRSTSDP